jgi:hypothetical protein
MQNKIKFLDESSISFKIENSMLEVYDQYDELIGSQPLPIPYEENMSGDEIYQKAQDCGYDIDDMISDIVKKAIEDTRQYDFWLSDDVVIFYSPSKQCCTSEPYDGVFAKLREIYMAEKKNFELGIDNVETENLDCPIEDNDETLVDSIDDVTETEEVEEIEESVVEVEEVAPIVEEPVAEEVEVEPEEVPVLTTVKEEVVVEEKKPVPTPTPKQNPQPKHEEKKPQNNQPNNQKQNNQQNNQKQNNQPKNEEKKPQNNQPNNQKQNNQPNNQKQNNQPKNEEKKPQNNQPTPKQNNQVKEEVKAPAPQPNNQKQNNQPAPKVSSEASEINFFVTNDSKKISEFKAALTAIANYNSKNSDRKIGEVANMVVKLIEDKGINPNNANEKDLVYDLAVNNVTIIEGLSPVRAGIYKAMLLKELKNLGF